MLFAIQVIMPRQQFRCAFYFILTNQIKAIYCNTKVMPFKPKIPGEFVFASVHGQ